MTRAKINIVTWSVFLALIHHMMSVPPMNSEEDVKTKVAVTKPHKKVKTKKHV